MNKHLRTICIITQLLLTSTIIGQVNNNETPLSSLDLTPSRTFLHMGIDNIVEAKKTLEIFAGNFDKSGYYEYISILIDILKNRVHREILKPEFLKEAGIDINSPVYIAFLHDSHNIENSIIYLPVIDAKKFPYKFIKILKELKKDPKLDLNPVITGYKDSKIFQIQKDIFFTVIDKNFILTSKGELIREIIDLKSPESAAPASNKDKPKTPESVTPVSDKDKPAAPLPEATSPVKDKQLKALAHAKFKRLRARSLAQDKRFVHFTGKKDKSYPLHIFVRGEFLDKMELYQKEDDDKKENEPGFKSTPPSIKKKKRSRFRYIEYIALGLKSNNNTMNIKGYISLNIRSTLSKLIIMACKTGMADKSIYMENPIAYGMVSMDADYLRKSFKHPRNRRNLLFLIYSKIKIYLVRNLGINIDNDLTPYFDNVINLALKRSEKRRRFDNYLMYFPLTKAGENEELRNKLKKAVKKRYNKPGRFGTGKLDGTPYFWFADKMGNKNNIFINNNKFFMSNEAGLIESGINMKDKSLMDINTEFKTNVDKDTFLLLYARFDEDTLLKMMLGMMIMKQNQHLAMLLDDLEDISVIGRRIDNFFSFDLKIKTKSMKK